jgi:glycosyltransferase involved in cell wall biosynthesis
MKISCVVPAFNEGARVAAVLKVIVGHELIDEVIVVNDGSSDNSKDVLKKIKGIRLISYKKNQGKSHAVKLGIEAAKNEWIMMMDSDLSGLKKRHITHMIEPIKKGVVDVTMAVWENSMSICKFVGFDIFAGERVFKKSMIKNLSRLDKLPGFGLEVFLNEIMIKNKFRIGAIKLDNVFSTPKRAKFGF